MGLKCVHEAAHSLYIKYVYNGTVADTFLGDDVFGADRIISVEKRVDNTVKRVRKLTETAKRTVGQSGRGGITSGKRGGSNKNYSGGKQQLYNKQNDYN